MVYSHDKPYAKLKFCEPINYETKIPNAKSITFNGLVYFIDNEIILCLLLCLYCPTCIGFGFIF